MHISTLFMIGQFFVGLLFVFFGVRNYLRWNYNLQQFTQRNIPSATIVLAVAIAVEIIAGLAVMFDLYAKLAAVLLILLTIGITYVLHNFWQKTAEERWKHINIAAYHLAVIGALLMIIGK